MGACLMYLKNLYSGSLFRTLGTTPGTLWVERIGGRGVPLPWSIASASSGLHPYVATDEHGNPQERES